MSAAQTALAILADAAGDELAQALHQDFKGEFIARAGREGFELTVEEVERWVQKTPQPFGVLLPMYFPSIASSYSWPSPAASLGALW